MADKNKPRLRVLLADDHVTVRHGLKLIIEGQPDMTVVAEASDGETAIEQALALEPDVVVMDISMPGMTGLVATRKLKKLRPDAAIITLTRHGDDAYLQELLRAGVAGYVLKQSPPTELRSGDPCGRGRRPVSRLVADRARDRRLSRPGREA